MATNFIQGGGVLTWANGSGSAVSSGDVVVMGDIVGIALTDIPDGASGAVAIEGVWSVAKTAGTAWALGDKLDYDVDPGAFHKGLTEATGDVSDCAIAAEAALAAATTGKVKLTPPGAIN